MNLQLLYITTAELADAFLETVERNQHNLWLLQTISRNGSLVWYVEPKTHFGIIINSNWRSVARRVLSECFDAIY